MEEQIISVITGSTSHLDLHGCKRSQRIQATIGIAVVEDDNPENIGMVEVYYPCLKGNLKTKGYIDHTHMNMFNMLDKLKIRPATEDEIRKWKHADGNDGFTRARADTPEKLKELVKHSLERGEKIITRL